MNLTRLFLPGRPRHVLGGERVWLRHRDRLFFSYKIKAVVEEEVRHSTIDGQDFGSGWSLLLVPGSGRRANKPLAQIADPDDVRDSWGRGLRYLTPGAKQFVRIGGRPTPRDKAAGRLVPPDYGTLEATLALTKRQVYEIDRAEARLVKRYIEWMNAAGALWTMAVRVGRHEIRADLYDPTNEVLIEAKGSTRRDAIRMAVGQLLDYARFAPDVVGATPALAVLVPAKPEPDLMRYLSSTDIAAIWQRGPDFLDSVGGQFTTPRA